MLEFVRVHELTAWVRPASTKSARVPRWAGGQMALSGELAAPPAGSSPRRAPASTARRSCVLLQPLLALQARWSALPAEDEWLVESIATRDGHGLFFYPFEGRLVHLGLATLFSYRLSRATARTISLTANDYGFGLVCPDPLPLTRRDLGMLLAAPDVERDLVAGLNAAELGRRQFRETARIAGLVFQGYPGQPHPARQLQASSALLYEVFAEYDPDNRLLAQATREVLDRRLEAPRLAATLARLRGAQALCTRPARPTPFAFPLLVEMFRDSMTHRGAGGAGRADGRRARAGGRGRLTPCQHPAATSALRCLRRAGCGRCRECPARSRPFSPARRSCCWPSGRCTGRAAHAVRRRRPPRQGGSLRAGGVPVPRGATATDLARLDALVQRTGAGGWSCWATSSTRQRAGCRRSTPR